MNTLPNELLDNIAAHLSLDGLTRISRTCRHLNHIAEPLFFREIELHPQFCHTDLLTACEDDVDVDSDCEDVNDHGGDSDHGNDSKPEAQLLSDKSPRFGRISHDRFRLYHNTMDDALNKSLAFFRYCDRLRKDDRQRWLSLARRVHRVCVTIDMPQRLDGHQAPDWWNTLLSFPNLDSLNIIARWTGRTPPLHNPTKDNPTSFARLRHLRLRGYVPQNFVSQILSGPDTRLDTLNLALLAPSTRAPRRGRQAWPPPLPSPFLQPAHLSASLSALTSLHLTMPTTGANLTGRVGNRYLAHVPQRSHFLREWATLIDRNRRTLSSLTLDLRSVADVPADDLAGQLYAFEDELMPVFFGSTHPRFAGFGFGFAALRRLRLFGVAEHFEEPADVDLMELDLRMVLGEGVDVRMPEATAARPVPMVGGMRGVVGQVAWSLDGLEDVVPESPERAVALLLTGVQRGGD